MTAKNRLPSVVSPYERYLAEIVRFPILSKGEEKRLAIKFYKTGDLDAAHKLTTANLRFVVKVANEYLSYGARIMDLIQEGNIGLMQAIKAFNPYKNVRLITYAVWWIRAYIHDYIQRNWSLVKIGTTQAQKKLFYKLKQEKKKLEALGGDMDLKKISKKLGFKEKEVIEMDRRLAAPDVSLNAPLRAQEKNVHLDFIVDSTGNVEEVLAKKEEEALFKKKVAEFLPLLKGRDLYIFKNRLLAENPMTLQAIGDKFNITKERVRQIEEKLKKKLRKFVEKDFRELTSKTKTKTKTQLKTKTGEKKG